MSLTPMRLMIGRIVRISSVSPEFEMARTMSAGVIMPRSPCEASPGCTKNDGVPVLASVAAILPPMCPDLPIPMTMTRPVQARISRHASANCPFMCFASVCNASASSWITSRPSCSNGEDDVMRFAICYGLR